MGWLDSKFKIIFFYYIKIVFICKVLIIRRREREIVMFLLYVELLLY